jgi:hypothetical protein
VPRFFLPLILAKSADDERLHGLGRRCESYLQRVGDRRTALSVRLGLVGVGNRDAAFRWEVKDLEPGEAGFTVAFGDAIDSTQRELRVVETEILRLKAERRILRTELHYLTREIGRDG